MPIIYHIPHASRHIPDDLFSDFCISRDEIKIELLKMTDHFTDLIFKSTAAIDDSIIEFPVSRIVVDPERFSDDSQEVMSTVGMGAVYTKRHNGETLRCSMVNRNLLLERFYKPHHLAIDLATADHLNKYGKALILDCHSFSKRSLPYELDQHAYRPQICIGTDDFHTPGWLKQHIHDGFVKHGFEVGFNTPFSDTFVPSPAYKINPNVLSAMIELRRDLYMDEKTGEILPNISCLISTIKTIANDIRNSFLVM